MRELRHDFRAVYGTSYDSVPTDEAIDLIKTLPDGSLYVCATEPLRSWTPERHRFADVVDAINHLTWAAYYNHDKVPYPPTTVRPADVAAREAQRKRRKRAIDKLNNTRWTEV